jgi:hypothetical protein
MSRAPALAAAVLVSAACLRAYAGELVLDIGDIEAAGFSARGFSARLVGPKLRDLDLRIERIAIAGLEWRKVRLTCADLETGRRIACASGVLHLPEKIPVSFSYSTATQDLALEVAPTPHEKWRVAGRIKGGDTALEVKIDKGRLERFAALLPTAIPKLTGGTATGSARLKSDSIAGRLDLEGIAFADASGLHAGEKVAATLEADATLKGEEWRWNARAAWRAGEVFWQPLFMAAKGQQLRVQGVSARGRSDVTQGTLDLPQIGTVAFTARWNHSAGKLDALTARAERLKVAPLYEQMLKPIVQQTALGDLRTDGEISVALNAAGGAISAVDVELHALSAEDRQQRRFAVFGASGRVPWKRDAATTGELAIKGAEFLKIALGPVKIPLRMRGGTGVSIPAVRVPILDGALQLRDFAAGMTDEGWGWRFGGQLEPISMVQLTQAMGTPVMHGSLSGTIPDLRYRRGTLTMDGALVINVFDGVARASAVELIEPFGRAPRLHADLDLRNLDLGLLTRTFDFGTITGRIDARVKGLELVDWQPVRMDMQIESSPGDYPKRISQRAVQNITALGGAGAAAAIQRSFLRFFEQFGYEKIGLNCKLENNVCEMSGVERAPQGYVIVKGGGIPAISVIGYNRSVSWRELLDRLKRITQENVKPVVK